MDSHIADPGNLIKGDYEMEVTIRIYQLDMVRAKKLIFNEKKLEILETINPEKYNFVYEDVIDVDAIDDICVIFGDAQTDPRRGLFRGWPIRTNDLIEVIHGDAYTLYQFYRDDWDDGSLKILSQAKIQTVEQNGRKYDLSMAADRRNCLFGVLAKPKEPAVYVDIELCDTVVKSMFGHHYKALCLPSGECLLCSEGVFSRITDENASTLNRMLLDNDGNGYGIVSGPIFFCKMNQQGNLCSLSPNECAKLYNRYYLPENFYVYRRELRSVKNYPMPVFGKGAGQ